MKRIAQRFSQCAVVAGLALGAQFVWSGEGYVEIENDVRDLAQASVVDMPAVGATMSADSVGSVTNSAFGDLLEDLGLAGVGAIPSSGGPIDE